MRSFKKNIYKLNSKSCNLEPLSVITTDPTNEAGDNGTATITYSGNQGIISYNINNGTFVTVTSSPFIITGLSASTEYTIIVKDSFEEVKKAILEALDEYDVIMTTGGTAISKGDVVLSKNTFKTGC